MLSRIDVLDDRAVADLLHRAQSPQGLPAIIAVCQGEPLASERALVRLRAAAQAAGYLERRVSVLQARGFDAGRWLAECNEGSLFAERRVEELRIPSGKPGTEGSKVIQALVAKPPSDRLVLITLPELEWSVRKSVWFQSLEEATQTAAVVLESVSPPLDRLPQWIQRELAQQQQSASLESLSWLAERFEGNLLAADQELKKLALLLPTGKLDDHEIRNAVLDVARWDPADLARAALLGDANRVLKLSEGLRAEGLAAPLAIWLVAEDLRACLKARQALDAGRPEATLARELRLSRDRAPALISGARRLSASFLLSALGQLAQCDRLAKGIGRGDPWTALTNILLLTAQPSRFRWTLGRSAGETKLA